MLLDEWRKFKGFAVLEYFLWNGEKIHIKGLARLLEISPNTAADVSSTLREGGILNREEAGNIALYGSSGNSTVAELKRMYILLRISKYAKSFVEENKNISSLILYGGTARGEYDRNSDVDLLAISQSKSPEPKGIRAMEAGLGREVKIEVLGLGELRKLADKKDTLYVKRSLN
jgi:predicted nucleotidyltransferase